MTGIIIIRRGNMTKENAYLCENQKAINFACERKNKILKITKTVLNKERRMEI